MNQMIANFKKNKQKTFRNKTILITGSGRGFGAELALYFSKLGANVIINNPKSNSNKEPLVFSKIKKINKRSMFIEADVSDRKQVEKMMKTIHLKYNRIDVLINNAAVFLRPTGWLEMSENDFDQTIKVNLKGVYECCRAAAPYMLKNKGSKIINLSTLGGDAVVAAYVISKIAVNHLTKVFAKEFAPNINVNALAFSKIEIGMGKPDNLVAEKNYISQTPLKRLGSSSDIFSAISFLASKESSFITGHVLVVDGGRCIRSL
jgi:3-oxoacyl-[acyl-carrier protein] reductase